MRVTAGRPTVVACWKLFRWDNVFSAEVRLAAFSLVTF